MYGTMTTWKTGLLQFMCASGALTPFRLANRGKVLILTYHRFSNRDDGFSASARVLREQLEYLTTHYKIMSLGQIVKWCDRGVPLPASVAAITIDDGYRDVYEIAFPILARYKAPATLFVVTDFVDRKAWLWTDKMRFLAAKACSGTYRIAFGHQKLSLQFGDIASRRDVVAQVNNVLKTLPDEMKEEAIAQISSSLDVVLPGLPPDEFSSATWNQLREMELAGVEIGSHTMSHPILTNVNDDRLHREVYESRLLLESVLGHPVQQFCYPDGAYDCRVKRAVERAGYRYAVTTASGLNGRRDDPLALRRVPTELDLPHFVQSTSGVEQMKTELKTLLRNVVSAL